LKYYLIAGEASGDLHGGNLMDAIKQQDAQAHFRFWGGDKMAAHGGTPVKHYKDLAFMGFVEVLMHLRTILNNIRFCKKDILEFQPDVLVLIDYPGFNMRIAKFAKAQGIKVVYYISPQIWAWKQHRVHQIKKTVDRMLTILPFEVDFYKKFEMEVDFVGHPLLDEMGNYQNTPAAKALPEMRMPYILLLPGSRKQEIQHMLPVMVQMEKEFPDYQFVVAAAPGLDEAWLRTFIGNMPIIKGKTYTLMQHAHAALVTSGTATLETALFGAPQVVCYKGGRISYLIAKQLIKVPYISLVNLVMDRAVVTELIQDAFNPAQLKMELNQILIGPKRNQMQKDYAELRQILGGSGASEKAAAIVVETASSKGA
jgi:lipid-A-disaccharide synthase